MKKVMSMFLVACVIASSIFAGGASETTATTPEKVVTIAQSGQWDVLMPMEVTNQGTDNLFDLVFDRLLVIRKDGNFDPRLAESYEVNETSDVITYHLNKDAKWHDGTPVTASDVVFSAKVASTSEHAYPRRIRMQYFTGTDEFGEELTPGSVGVVAVDDHTVEFHLKTPMDPMLINALIVRDFYIIPEHLLKDIPAKELPTHAFWQAPIGSGPCKFDRQIGGETIEFTANKEYHLGAPDFDRLVCRVMPSSNFLAGLMSGEVDVISGDSAIPLTDWEAAVADPNIVTVAIPTFGYQTMVLNTQHLPQTVRQAINIGINRQALVDALLMGQGEPVIGPIVPGHPYFNENVLPIEYNPEKAKAMIAESGFDTSKTLHMIVSTGNEIRQKSAVLLQQDLAKIGLNVEIQTIDFPTLLTSTRNGDFDFSFIGFQGSIDPAESVPNLTVGYINNFSNLTDPTIGELGFQGTLLTTFEERKAVFDEYQMLIKEQVPYAYLYEQHCLNAHTNRISNIPVEDVDFQANKCVWQWKVN